MIARLTSRAMAAGQLLEPSLSTRLRACPGSLMRTSRGFFTSKSHRRKGLWRKLEERSPVVCQNPPVLSEAFALGQAEALAGDYLSGESRRYS